MQDARIRRLPFQQKIGAVRTTKQFQRGVDDGTLRQVGFTESINMIGDALGWKLDDDIVPKIADTPVASELLAIDGGRSAASFWPAYRTSYITIFADIFE